MPCERPVNGLLTGVLALVEELWLHGQSCPDGLETDTERPVNRVLAVGAELGLDGQSCPDGLLTGC